MLIIGCQPQPTPALILYLASTEIDLCAIVQFQFKRGNLITQNNRNRNPFSKASFKEKHLHMSLFVLFVMAIKRPKNCTYQRKLHLRLVGAELTSTHSIIPILGDAIKTKSCLIGKYANFVSSTLPSNGKSQPHQTIIICKCFRHNRHLTREGSLVIKKTQIIFMCEKA